MGPSGHVRHRRRVLLPAVAAAALVTAPAAQAATKHKHKQHSAPGPWSAAVELAKPAGADLQPPTLGISPSGNVSVGYGVTPEDAPQDAYAALIVGRGGSVRTVTTKLHGHKITQQKGTLGARFEPPELVPAAEQVLALGTLGGQPELLTGDGNGGALTGDAASGVACCTDTGAQGRVSRGLYTGLHSFATETDGGALGTLVPEVRGALAIVAGADGIWTAYGSNRKGFRGPAHELAAFKGQPPTVAVGTLSGGRGVVVWTEPRNASVVPSKSQKVYYAVAPAGKPAGTRRLALSVPAGYSVSQVAVTRGRVANIAWVESWLDVRGKYHSRVYTAQIAGRRAVKRRVVSPVNVIASQISFAGGAGHELLTWQACAPHGTSCEAQARLRLSASHWSSVARLGEIDAGGGPVAAMTTRGTALVAWVSRGDVMTVNCAKDARKFTPKARRLGRSGRAAQLTLAAGPLGTAAAVWTNGTVNQSLHAALYRPAAEH
jgi:hypothetical protein